jgi:hypothetical protein
LGFRPNAANRRYLQMKEVWPFFLGWRARSDVDSSGSAKPACRGWRPRAGCLLSAPGVPARRGASAPTRLAAQTAAARVCPAAWPVERASGRAPELAEWRSRARGARSPVALCRRRAVRVRRRIAGRRTRPSQVSVCRFADRASHSGAPESICNRVCAHAVPTICPQLQITSVNYRYVVSQLRRDLSPRPASLRIIES